jgi:hypothetical protein
MKMLRVALIAAAAATMATVPLSQKSAQKRAARPVFSGTWTLDAQASGIQATGGLAAPLKVTHTRDRLVVERGASDGGTITLTYRLDGTSSTNQYTVGAGRMLELKSTTKWVGDALEITTPRGVGDPVVEAWSIKDNVLTIQVGAQKRIYKRSVGR